MNAKGVHLVGSVPLATEEDVFRTVCKMLPHHLKRVPDGEVGSRGNFITWQMELFRHEPRLLNALWTNGVEVPYTEDQEEEVLKCFDNFETRFEHFALRSYDTFKRLRSEGIIPHGVRFQVGLATPLTAAVIIPKAPLRKRFEELYQSALLRSLDQIQGKIPAADLAIQWDMVFESFMLEGQITFLDARPWFEPVFEGIVERLAGLVEHVAEGVEVGLHLCYGDAEHKHIAEPKDLSTVVQISNGVMAKSKRQVNWLHFPVPIDRKDREYFTPLQLLKTDGKTDVVLGLVHYNDLEGTKARAATASEFLDRFQVATECGMGRTPPEQIQNILEIAAAVA